MKRILLFVLTNLAVMVVLGVVASLLGVNRYLTANGLQLSTLLGFSLVMGFGGAIISLLLSKPMAKWSTGAQVINQPQSADEQWIVDTVRRDYPDLPIFARARNVTHYYQLIDLGVTMIERETYESALKLGRTVLTEGLGQSAYRTRNAANRFRRHNKQSLEAVY